MIVVLFLFQSHVAIVAQDSDIQELRPLIERYIKDVSKRNPGVKFEVLSREWKTPKEIREALSKIPKLEGAILLGKLPLMKYKGDPLGRAWLKKDQLSELDEQDVAPSHASGKTSYHDHTLSSRGSALLGDPFVRLRD